MPTTIVSQGTGAFLTLDETADITHIQNTCPGFFKKPHGKRETYQTYRGQLIVRHTATFGGRSERRTVVYIFIVQSSDPEWNLPNFLCASGGNDIKNVRQAQKLIDRILTERRYAYDMNDASKIIKRSRHYGHYINEICEIESVGHVKQLVRVVELSDMDCNRALIRYLTGTNAGETGDYVAEWLKTVTDTDVIRKFANATNDPKPVGATK